MKHGWILGLAWALGCGDGPSGAGGAGGTGGLPGLPPRDGGPSGGGGTGGSGGAGPRGIGPVAAEPQRSGDPAAGYRALVNEGFVTCGIPYSLYQQFLGGGGATLPGRTGDNATMPYSLTRTRSPEGADIVAPNCLICHAGEINGQLVVGLGNAFSDYTQNLAVAAEAAGGLLQDGTPEKVAWRKWADRVVTISPYTTTDVIGVNPADNLAAILFSHRDPTTLAWSNEALLEPPPAIVVPVDVPPWWRMKKKNAMFYNAAGRGDQARIMMTASTLCTDSVAEAQHIDSFFGDVRAFIASIEPPRWPWPVDGDKAARGKAVYVRECARCHGTYGEGGEYPNLVVDLADVDTDGTLVLGASQFAGRFLEWYSRSFYGQTSRLEPADGYIAPPLDGIWATAPFLHNGSVPTLAALLDSSKRPTYWKRRLSSTDYDQAEVGFHHDPIDRPDPNAAASEMLRTYDTTRLGYSNKGHRYGDALSATDRSDVIEYLKTL